jgi:D-glycerate 3-kinase
LQQRGYPGTHDIRLGSATLAALKAISSAQKTVAIPRYDKSAHGGEGDRMPMNEWQSVMAPLDFVILEGWCVGFTPLPETDIQDAHLSEINKMLAQYAAWHNFLDAFIQLRAQRIGDVVRWRIEAEQKMRAQGKPGMSDEKIQAYIERFLPAYEMYLPVLEKKPPVSLPRLVVDIATERSLAGIRQF